MCDGVMRHNLKTDTKEQYSIYFRQVIYNMPNRVQRGGTKITELSSLTKVSLQVSMLLMKLKCSAVLADFVFKMKIAGFFDVCYL